MSEKLTDTELAALTALVNADTMMMDSENTALVIGGGKPLYGKTMNKEWIAKKVLEQELKNRGIIWIININ